MAKKSRTSKKNSSKRVTRRNNAKSSRKMLSVNDIRSRFQDMDTSVKQFIKVNNPRDLGKHVSRQWSKLFNKPLSGKAASSLVNHYMNKVRGPTKKNHRGGSMGAPLDYVMRPGLPAVATYATFPTEVGPDAKSAADLDVYYNSGMGRSCGTENTTAHVPASMGSNKVGGARRTRKHRGGDFMAALGTRAYISNNPATSLQQGSEYLLGRGPSPYDVAEPSQSAFRLVSDGKLPINPSGISVVDKDITQLANPSPYPAVK